jgi:ABC-type dipeptide/oligopeptide/nickel transport system ATPase component
MKIKYFKYENKSTGLKINTIDFNSNLTLLVGASGVGKSLILKALIDMRKIADGRSINGVEWEIEFLSDTKHDYIWKGAFESKVVQNITLIDDYEEKDTALKPKIKKEELWLNNIIIVKRDNKETLFNEKPAFPKPSSYESVLSLFKEAKEIIPINNNVKQIKIMEDFDPRVFHFFSKILDILEEYKTIDKIQHSSMPTIIKLHCVYKNLPDIFNKIKKDFVSIFPQIKDIRIKLVVDKNITLPASYVSLLEIKEKNVNNWISQQNISLGMLKTLSLISELYLCENESTILLDEFENSFGVNCMDSAVDNILNVNRDLQFIITSHHPYIINNIDMSHWKVVSRKGGIISTKNARDYGLDKYDSHHEAFLELLQLSDYSNGIN